MLFKHSVILQTRVASWYTISDLFRLLCTRDCRLCGSFGGFIFLPTFIRCCFSCIREDLLPSVSRYRLVKQRIKQSPTHIRRSIIIKTLPGIYSLDDMIRRRRIKLVPADPVIGQPLLCEEDDMPRMSLTYMVTTSLSYLDVESSDVQSGICCSGCQTALEKVLGSLRVPCDAVTQWDKVYSYDGFMERFQRCREAQNIWKRKFQGVDVANLSSFVSRGGFFRELDVIMSLQALASM